MLAGLLGAAMVLSSLGTPAWADGAARPNLPTIDTTQKGTLTINKYEGTDENTSNDKPLAGVEFTIWKVADIEQDTSPSSNVGFKFVPVSTLTSLTAEDFKSDKTDADKYTKEIYDKVLAKLNKNKKVEDGTICFYCCSFLYKIDTSIYCCILRLCNYIIVPSFTSLICHRN